MFYLGLAFSVVWIVTFIYLFSLDRQITDVKSRLRARDSSILP